ncbi:MAG TPA: sugar phosphate isomerase/epimerase [Granulicella sp.]
MSNALSRRDLLRTGAIAAAAASLPVSLTAQAPETFPKGPFPVRLGLCSYTFRNFSRTQMIGFMKQLHVTELNAKDAKDHLPTDTAEETKAIEEYTAANIHLHAAGAIYFDKNEDEDIRKKFEYCKRAGIGTIVAGDPTPDTLPRIERFVKEYDIRIAIHNHGPEDKLWQSPLDILKLVKKMDPRIGCCIDVGHTVRAGTDVVKAIHEVGPRLLNMHMKDLTSFTDKASQVAVGEGKMPIRGIFEALIQIGYKGFVDLEYEVHADDPMPGVIASFSYMRGVLAGMGYGENK